MNSARMVLATMIAIILVSSSVALAIVPLEIGFQGRLVLSDGSTPPDGTYEVIFSMWNDPTGGSMLWSETQQVEVLDGQFDVELGSVNDIPMEELSLNYEEIDLQMQVMGDTPMMPRIPLNSVPYSLVSSRIQGDVFTQPGVISVGLQQPDFKWAEMSGLIAEAKLSLGGQEGEDIVSLSADDQGAHFFMVDSFFDVEYRIQLETTTDGGDLTISNIGSSGEDGVAMHIDPLGSRLVVSNIGSSGEDGVSVDVSETGSSLALNEGPGSDRLRLSADDGSSSVYMVDSFFDVEYRIVMSTSSTGGGELILSNIGSSGEDGVSVHVGDNDSHLIVSNIGSSGQDGVSINVNDGAATCGIEHEDIGGSVSFANSSADATASIHEVGHYLSLDHTFGASIEADDNGAGLHAIDSFFDVEHRIDHHASDTEALSTIQAEDQTRLFKRIDRATPNLYQATCDGAHENGHSFITQLIDNQGSSGQYRWMPEVGDEVLVGFHAGAAGGTLTVSNIGSSGEDGVSVDVGGSSSTLIVSNIGSSGLDGVSIGVEDGAATCGIEHEDIGGGGGSIQSSASAAGGTLTVSNIGSSGEDGVVLLSDALHSMLTIQEGGNNSVQLSSDGSTDQLSLGDLNSEGRMDLVAGSSSSDVSVFFSDAFGKSGVALGSAGGAGGGGRIALMNQALGEPVPIEIVALSLVSSEPIVLVRNPNYLPTDSPVLELDYDALGRLTQTMRDSESAPGESTKTSTDGFHVFDSGSEMHLDTRGLFFADATGPTCSMSPYGDVTLKRGVIMAQDPGTTVGIGAPSSGFKLWVDGDMCATGFIGPCSDARYKKNVESIDNALEMITRLRGVRFDWRTDEFEDRHFSDRRQVGMIAQEVEKVVPELVNKDSEGYYSLDYARLTPILVEAIREQQAKIEKLEQKIEDNSRLRAEIEELKSIVHSLASDREKEDDVVMTGADNF